MTVEIHNGRVRLALHERKGGAGVPLLLLHALYGSSADWPAAVDGWPGPVHALDFSGHGESAWVRGGSYHIERFLSDADLALRAIGSAAVAGAGVGAWYALLLAGTRSDRVPACLLLPGAGLVGGGIEPDPLDTTPTVPDREEIARFEGHCDPYCMAMERDPRPPSFAEPFAKAARRILMVEDRGPLPPWWETARACGAEVVDAGPAGPADLEAALAALARHAGAA